MPSAKQEGLKAGDHWEHQLLGERHDQANEFMRFDSSCRQGTTGGCTPWLRAYEFVSMSACLEVLPFSQPCTKVFNSKSSGNSRPKLTVLSHWL